MFLVDARAVRITWSVILTALLCAIVYQIRDTLFVFVLAILFAYLLSPLVGLLDRALPLRRSRTAALAIAYLSVVGLIGAVIFAVGSQIAEEAAALARQVPALLTRLQEASQRLPAAPPESFGGRIAEQLREVAAARLPELVSELPSAGLRVLSIAGNSVYIILIPILSFFFFKDGRELLTSAIERIPEASWRREAYFVVRDVHQLLGHYMRAVFLLSTISFAAFAVFLGLARVPYALLLAAAAFAGEFIPVAGPVGVGLLTVGVALATGYDSILMLVVFLVVYRLFLDYVLMPQVMSSGIALHPLAVIFGVLAGAHLGGMAGAFLSLPVLAVARVLLNRVFYRRPALNEVTQ